MAKCRWNSSRRQYRTTKDIVDYSGEEVTVEQIDHCTGYCPDKEELIIPSLSPTTGKTITIFSPVDERVEDDELDFEEPTQQELRDLEKIAV